MLGCRDFGPADWPGHDAQGEGIEGEKGVDVKEWGGVMRGIRGAEQGPSLDDFSLVRVDQRCESIHYFSYSLQDLRCKCQSRCVNRKDSDRMAMLYL